MKTQFATLGLIVSLILAQFLFAPNGAPTSIERDDGQLPLALLPADGAQPSTVAQARVERDYGKRPLYLENQVEMDERITVGSAGNTNVMGYTQYTQATLPAGL